MHTESRCFEGTETFEHEFPKRLHMHECCSLKGQSPYLFYGFPLHGVPKGNSWTCNQTVMITAVLTTLI